MGARQRRGIVVAAVATAGVAALCVGAACCGGQPKAAQSCSGEPSLVRGKWQLVGGDFPCQAVCDDGWTSCTGTCDCRVTAPLPEASLQPADGAAGTGVTRVATLIGAPGGVAIEGTRVYYLDGDALRAVDAAGGPVTTLATDLTPAGGVAVRDGAVYVPVAQSPNSPGLVVVVAADGGTSALVADADPGAGIEVDDASVLWLSRSGFDAGPGVVRSALAGGASTWLLPADDDAGAYKSFAGSRNGVYGIAGGALALARLEGGVIAVGDGGVAVAACRLGWEVAITRDADGGESLDAIVDAALPYRSPLNGAVTALSCASDTTVLMATDERIYAVGGGTSTALLVDGQAGIAYVAGTASRVVWITRATQSQPGSVWVGPR